MSTDPSPPPGSGPADERVRSGRVPGAIRSDDVEPRLALESVSRVFRLAATVVLVATLAEVVMVLAMAGPGMIVPLVGSVAQGLVLAAVLWAAGDITGLLIDAAHDVRAARVLLGRLSARPAEPRTDRDRRSREPRQSPRTRGNTAEPRR